MEDQEVIKEFVIESNENLTRLDTEIVELEQRPRDPALLASIFRTIHTIKGTCGFLSFGNLERVTHIAENILSQLRNGERDLTPELTSLVLETMDVIRKELDCIENASRESGETYEDLRRRLTITCNQVRPDALAQPSPADGATESLVSAVQTPVVAQLSVEPETVVLDGGARAPIDSRVPASPDSEKQVASRGGSIADSTIRVDVGLLDKLMNLVGELVLARNQILQFNSRQDDATLNATSQRLNLITTQLQEGVMKTRMQPIGVVWNKLPRVVRDLAASCGKQISLEMDGAETELDKSIIEAIKDPLTHIVRNCCDHGIESPEARAKAGKSAQGHLMLRAYHEGGQVNIEIIDDGGGINGARVKQKAVERGLLRPEQAEQMSERESINLIFLPGLSTAKEVTSISGRGVGMDVVKTNIEKIGGTVDLTSRAGQGTTVKIKIPLTLAIIPGLVIGSGGERFIIPQVSLLELLRLEGESGKKQIECIHGAPVYRRRGSLLPVAYLNQVLDLNRDQERSDAVNIVVLQAENRQFGLVVDSISDTQEIVVKPLGKQFKGQPAYAGATIMGDGKVALILDVVGVGQLAGVLAESRELHRSDGVRADGPRDERQTFLLFRAGQFERLAVPLSLVARLEEFPLSRIEHASGQMVVQYRERILRLTSLSSTLGGVPNEMPDPVPVIVFSEGDRMAGLVVDQIVDIHDESIVIGARSSHPGLSGSAVLGGKVTDFLDLPSIMEAAREGWAPRGTLNRGEREPVLIVDPNAFSRGLVRNYLELSGQPVVEALDRNDALAKLERNRVSAVLTSEELPGGIETLVSSLRSRPELGKIPLLALSKQMTGPPVPGIDARVNPFDRSTLLQSLTQLSAAVGTLPAALVEKGR